MVYITKEEASLLVSKLEQRVKTEPQIISYLKQQAQYNEGQIDQFWKLPKDKSACVFLNLDGLCSIYKDRPSSCRNFMVTSNPSQCSKTSSLVDKYVSISGEVIASAALGMPNQIYEPMPISLLKEMKLRGSIDE
jgi:Fe-S-cluster containining protein